MDSFNPLFAFDDNTSSIVYEQRILELEGQVNYHKQISQQLQASMLNDAESYKHRQPVPPIPTHPKIEHKRKYTVSSHTIRLRTFVRDQLGNDQYAIDLINGVGLSNVKPNVIPKALLRSYITYRFEHDGR